MIFRPISNVVQSVLFSIERPIFIGVSSLLSGWLLSGLGGWGTWSVQPASAQVVVDDSLGTVIQSSGAGWLVEQGSQAGENLFHSFEQFSIPSGGQVRFESDSGIRRIFSRVTGGAASRIEGAIAANADLFLLNPNGILFGPGAQLNVSGQFVGTTAEQLEFSDGRLFSSLGTSPSEAALLLSLSMPVGLQFGSHSGDIEVTGSGHRLTTAVLNVFPLLQGDRNPSLTTTGHLALLGRNVMFSGGSLQVTGQRVELGAVMGEVVQLRPIVANSGWIFDYAAHDYATHSALDSVIESATDSATAPGNRPAGELRLAEHSLVEAESVGPLLPAGNIRLVGDRINLSGASMALLHNLGPGEGGEILVEAGSALTLDGFDFDSNVRSQLTTVSLGPGSGGNIRITAPSLNLDDAGAISAMAFATGPGGSVNIRGDRLELGYLSPSFREQLFTFAIPAVPGISAVTYGPGSAGLLQLAVQDIQLVDGGAISNLTFGAGDAGVISVDAQRITARGVSPVAPELNSGINSISIDSGSAQNVDITVDELILEAGATISSTVAPTLSSLGIPAVEAGLGKGGDVTVRASSSIEVLGFNPLLGTASSINSSTLGDARGGNTVIQTPSLSLRDGGAISSATLSSGDAGQLTIIVDNVEVHGVNAFNGNPSGILVSAPRVEPAVQQRFQLPAFPTGATGELTLWADRIAVSAGASITAQHEGEGDAGRLEITTNQLHLDQGAISAATVAGQGGNIRLDVGENLLLSQSSSISAESGDLGEGGNIDIASTTVIVTESSEILANARQGRGGNIDIATQSLLLSPSSQITASSELGVSGTVNISAPEGLPSLGLETLPEQVQDRSQLISQGCASPAENQFVTSGRGGLAETPTQPRPGLGLWRDRESGMGLTAMEQTAPELHQFNRSAIPRVPQRLVEAVAIRARDKGGIQLIGQDYVEEKVILPQHCLQASGASA